MTRRIGLIVGAVVGLILLIVISYFVYRYITRDSATITVWTIQGTEGTAKNVADKFRAQNRGYRVQIVAVPEQAYEMKSLFTLASLKGTKDYPIPDVWIMPNEWLTQHRNKLIAAPDTAFDEAITSYRPKGGPTVTTKGRTSRQILEQDYAPIVKTDLIFEDKAWGVPLYMDNLALYYDKTRIPTPPKTWQEVVNVTKQQTQRSDATITRATIALGDNESVTHFTDILSILMLQAGTKMVDEATKTATFNITEGSGTPPGTSALDFYTSFAKPGKEAYTWNKSLGNSLKALKDGKTAMALGYLNDAQTVGVGSRVAVAPLPQTNPASPQTYGRYLAATVTKHAGDPTRDTKAKAAWKFVGFMAHPAIAQQIANDLRTVPARSDLAKQLTLDQAYKPFFDQASQATTWRKAEVQVADGAFNEAINLVLKNNESPQKAIDVAAKAYTTFLQRETGIETDPAILSFWQPSEDTTDYSSTIRTFTGAHKDLKKVAHTKHDTRRFEWEVINAMAGKQGPDILLIPNDSVNRYALALYSFPEGRITDPRNASRQISNAAVIRQSYAPAVATDSIIRDSVYALPANLETLMLAYNNDLVNQFLRELKDKKPPSIFSTPGSNTEEDLFSDGPVTWDQLKTMARLATKKNGTTITLPFVAFGTGENVAHANDLFAVVLKQFGGDVADPDRNVTGIHLPISSRAPQVPGKQAEDLLKSFSQSSSENYSWNSSFPNSVEALADGKVMAAFVYPRDVKAIQERNPKSNLRFWALPQLKDTGDATDIASYYTFVIPVTSKNPNYTLQFILKAASSTSQEIIPPIKRPNEVLITKRSSGNPQVNQVNTAQSYYKGFYPDEVDASLKDLMDGKFSLDQAAGKINQSLKKTVP